MIFRGIYKKLQMSGIAYSEVSYKTNSATYLPASVIKLT